MSKASIADLIQFTQEMIDKYKILDVAQSRKDLISFLNPDVMRTLGTHRGIIRTLNHQITDEIHIKKIEDAVTDIGARHNRKDSFNYIYPGDRLLLSRLADSFSVVFDDIRENAYIYTELRDIDEDTRFALMEDVEQTEYRKKHIDSLIGRYGPLSKENIVELLAQLFPQVAIIYGKTDLYKEVDGFEDHRVAQRIVLDGYFSLNDNYYDYVAADQLVESTLKKLKSTRKVDERIRLFAEFGDESRRKNIHTHSYFIMQKKLRKAKALPSLQQWMKAELRRQYTGSPEEDKVAFGRILSAADTIFSLDGLEPNISKKHRIDNFFKGVESFYSGPWVALYFLLHLLPKQGNNFFNEYIPKVINDQYGLFARTLSWVDHEILVKDVDVLDKRYSYWAFVVYQWAYSIAINEPKINSRVPGANDRYKKVTKYLLDKMQADPQIAYRIIKERYEDKTIENTFFDERGMVIEKSFSPLSVEQVKGIIPELLKSSHVTNTQKRKLESIMTKMPN